MDKLPGTPYVLAQFRYRKPAGTSLYTESQYSTTVADFARCVEPCATLGFVNSPTRFFAASWNGRQHIAPNAIHAIHSEYQLRFELLSRVLPSRFQENLRKVRAGLPLLFTSTYPLALNHGDLSGMNILVDPNTGHITGVIDWAEATICPFGISLWGLENFLGSMNAQGWHYHLHHQALRDLFWQIFEDSVGGLSRDDKGVIEIARMAGLFLQYSFNWGSVSQEPVREGTTSFVYLDAFCATGN